MVVGIVDAQPAAAAATEAAVAVPSATPAPAPAPAEISPLLPVSPSLEWIAAEEHTNAVELARDEAAYSDIRRQNRDVRFARLRNANLRGLDARLDSHGLQHQRHEPLEQPGLSAVREFVADLQESYSDAVEAVDFIYSPGKRQFSDTPVKHIRPLMRGSMASSSSYNSADKIKKWHEKFDSEPHYW